MIEVKGRIAWKADCGEEDVQRLLKRCFEGKECWHILLRAGGKAFGRGNHVSPGLWTTGRVFSEEAELRWRRHGDTFDVTFLSERPLPEGLPLEPLLNENKQPVEWEVEETDLILWGERKEEDEGWMEAKIPGVISYPLDSKQGKAKITAVYYKRAELVQFTRFKRVEEV